MRKNGSKVAPSKGDVFRDLGFAPEEAGHLVVRSELMIKIETLLKARGLTQAEAAKVMRVSQPRVSDLLRGRLDLFSADALIDMLARLGVRIRLAFAPRKASRAGLPEWTMFSGATKRSRRDQRRGSQAGFRR